MKKNTLSTNLTLTRDQGREIDRLAIETIGIPGVILMENAGRSAAEYLLHLGVKKKVTICCGKGNNGGDGFVVARYLDNHNIPLRILVFADPNDITGYAKIHFNIALKLDLPMVYLAKTPTDIQFLDAEFSSSEWIVDALLGTGVNGSVQSPLKEAILAVNRAKAKVLAIDIPSGLDCDTGNPLGYAIQADHTITFVGLKKGFLTQNAKTYTGKIQVSGIGIPKKLISLFSI